MFRFKKVKRNDNIYWYLRDRGWDILSANKDASDFRGNKGLIKYLFVLKYHNIARGLTYCDWRA